ncbi:MAG TPA: exodeoxyribonuclease VII large subunit [Erysipelotrichaceae bacterium]|nr:exodeoxyribonuclease VII large subunit [Erysipelotrichaceae bacterium]
MSNSVWTVSYLLNTIKSTLDQNVLLKSFLIKGEISNFTAHSSGHWYFSLKDEQARISCVMFQGYTKDVLFKPKNGDKVLVRGAITVYNLQGQIQCSVFSMQNDGLGDLFIQYELLKKKLFDEGLFDINHKKKLPKFPESIGIVTGNNTAALQDILKTIQLRWPIIEVTIYPTLVQGELASNSIIKQLLKADNKHDVLILARGGGSIEDLWAFNNEKLARVIYQLNTPIITGVGHETDTTIVDMVSDFRAPTPTAAAQIAVPSLEETKRIIQQNKTDLLNTINRKLELKRNIFDQIKQNRYFIAPQNLWQHHQLELSILSNKLSQQNLVVQKLKSKLNQFQTTLNQYALTYTSEYNQEINGLKLRLEQTLKNKINKQNYEFKNTINLLNAYSPLNSLARGYSITKQDAHIIKLVEDVDYNREIEIRLYDGVINAKPIKKGEHNE